MDIAMKVAAAMLLLCSSAMVDAAASTTTGTNPSNSAANIEEFRVPKNKRCAFERALCVVDCTRGSGPGKPDPPEDKECIKSCMREITCSRDGSTTVANDARFGDNKSFLKKLLCSFERAVCLISCGEGGSPNPEMPSPYFFKPSCMTSCSADVMCR